MPKRNRSRVIHWCPVALLLGGLLLAVAAAEPPPAVSPGSGEDAMQARRDSRSGQIEITDAGRPVLRYNYQTIEPSDELMAKVHPNSRKYARARSDYIHPLYGPDGEILTKDFSPDHPHHRGIYWAWPEVRFNGQLGDLHALQRVFARPTGKIKLQSGPDTARVEAENLWKWEDQTPIVREWTTIRAHRGDEQGRHIDLKFEFTALVDGVSVARRGLSHYGGLNIRLSPVEDLQLVHYADPAGTVPRRAWSDSIGIRAGGTKPVGFAVFEKASNPYYPGDWITYDQLPWFQPAFPAAGVEYKLAKGRPLVLQYRLWIRRGGKATPQQYAQQWQAFNPPQDSH